MSDLICKKEIALVGRVEVSLDKDVTINFIEIVPISKIIDEIAKVTKTSISVNPLRLNGIRILTKKLLISCLIECICFMDRTVIKR